MTGCSDSSFLMFEPDWTDLVQGATEVAPSLPYDPCRDSSIVNYALGKLADLRLEEPSSCTNRDWLSRLNGRLVIINDLGGSSPRALKGLRLGKCPTEFVELAKIESRRRFKGTRIDEKSQALRRAASRLEESLEKIIMHLASFRPEESSTTDKKVEPLEKADLLVLDKVYDQFLQHLFNHPRRVSCWKKPQQKPVENN